MASIEGDVDIGMSTPNRIFVMGDVHGCIDELNALVDAIQYNYDAGDRIILAGDMVAKGPDSIGVLRRARKLKMWCVRGNHDDKVVRLATYVRQVPLSQRKLEVPEGPVYDPLLLDDSHMTIVANMTDDDYNFLKSCPMMLGIPTIKSLFVHAGVNPNIPLDQQEPYFVMNIRSITANGEPVRKASDGKYPWSDVWNNLQRTGSDIDDVYRKIYYGHASSRGLDLKEYSFGLDTGCVYGGNLTAIEIHTGKLTQIPCRAYAVKE
ncbi:Metallo-dependent phosphatase-like protein [Dichotomocladium elegans]|nr:Metallo-dependent phosphatase-like protein [Dichotomocladium elegans]